MLNKNGQLEESNLQGVFLIHSSIFADNRGMFREVFRNNDLQQMLGYAFSVAQVNHSRSSKGVLRGIHVAPWMKLVTVMRGEIQQVVVDLRPESHTFGRFMSVRIKDSDGTSIVIPPGFGNGFLALSEMVDYVYLTSDYWASDKEMYVIYNDRDLGIRWESDAPSLSDQDRRGKTVRELFPAKIHQWHTKNGHHV